MGIRSALGILYSVPLLGLVLFVFSVGYPPFDDATTLDLTTHMIQHIVIVVAGIMIAYPLHRKGYLRLIEGKNSGLVGLAVIVPLIAFWHLPQFWDAAVLNPLVHAVEHASFLLVGALIGSSMQTLTDRAKIDVLILGFFGHFFYGIFLISNYKIYPLYSIADQGALGIVMFSVGPFYWTGILYLIFRNRAWFREIPSSGAEVPEIPHPRASHGEQGAGSKLRAGARLIAPICSVVMIALLVGFFASSAVAIAMTSPPHQSSSTVQVLIVETPVTWNYYPQNVTVVLGVNSTVVWVSHSLAYDTVTGTNGTLSSGSIPPGGTFSFTFTTAGTYSYRCIYHPWMTGTVVVKARSG
ncbi:MAG TPA: DUF1404 family protein [Nitrososphaerales archaeon]|nr:DUF1404 family protein [Nitrososphaerales archaeon]